MKLLLLSLVLLIGMASQLWAQKPKVVWGPEYKQENYLKAPNDVMLGSDEKYFYVLTNWYEAPKILKFDYSGTLVDTKPTNYTKVGGPAKINKMIRLGGRTYAIRIGRNNETKTRNYYANEFVNGKFEEGIKFYSTSTNLNFGKFLGLYYGYNVRDVTDFGNVNLSADGEKLAIVSSMIGSKENEELKVVVFDKKLKIIWEKDFTTTITDKNMKITNIVVGNNGDVSLLVSYRDPTFKPAKVMPEYTFKVMRLSREGMVTTDITTPKDEAIVTGSLFPTSDNNVYFGGFITTTLSAYSSRDGVFFSVIGADGRAQTKTYRFKPEFVKGLATGKQNNLFSMYIDHVMLFEDGTFALVAEKYSSSTTTFDNGVGVNDTKSTTYYSDHIVIARFSSTGELLNLDKVLKKYENNAFANATYFMAQSGNKIWLIYNTPKMKGEPEGLHVSGKVFTDIASINGSEKMKITNLFSNKDLSGKLFSHLGCLDLGNDKMVIQAFSKGKYQYSIITLPN